MNTYAVKVYVATHWSVFTQADHFEIHKFSDEDPLNVFAKHLARDGFGHPDGKTWVMPGAILEIKQV